MKYKYLIITTLIAGMWLISSCGEDYLDQPPKGAYSDTSLANAKGVEGQLISTYAALDGLWFESWGNNNFNQNGGASNWIWGGIRSEDAYRGTEATDGVDIGPLERYEVQPSNPYLLNKWTGSYDGIGKANEALRTLAAATDVSDEARTRITGELRFLRGHFHFEAKKTFGNPPYVDELVEDFAAVTNDADIWPQIEADFEYAFENLPGTQLAAGRANKWAAAAYLGKTYLYQGKWSEAKSMFDQVINNGTTAAGTPLALSSLYHNNFDAAAEAGNPESLFAYEASNAGDIVNGNYENTLNQPHGSAAEGAGCCGFYQPSQNLVNSFKVDANGLPMPSTFNDDDLLDDEGFLSSPAWDAEKEYVAGDFVGGNHPDDPNIQVYFKASSDNVGQDPADGGVWEIVWQEDAETPLDPRIDWTIGRKGIPYLDWGLHPGNNWIRDVTHGGPYSPIKNVPKVSDFGNNLAGVYDWGFTLTALNVHIIRFADVILMAAEAEAELGNLARATELVNMIRTRASNPGGFVKNSDGTPAANYQIGTYSTFGSQQDALTAIRFERKIEFGMEGHRFFDLARWDNMTDEGKTALSFDIVAHLNDYLAGESDRGHLANAMFQERHKYAPIPEFVITQSTVDGVQNIKQNDGF